MTMRAARDIWVEMSIREICTQGRFAAIAFGNIDPKVVKGTDAVFSSIHSFLSHCAMISKMLRAADDQIPPTHIGDILRVLNSSAIHDRKFRNNLEHYDERLRAWIATYGPETAIGTYNVGPRAMFNVPGMLYVSHYDPMTGLFTFVNEDFDLGVLAAEAQRITQLADKWVAENPFRRRSG